MSKLHNKKKKTMHWVTLLCLQEAHRQPNTAPSAVIKEKQDPKRKNKEFREFFMKEMMPQLHLGISTIVGHSLKGKLACQVFVISNPIWLVHEVQEGADDAWGQRQKPVQEKRPLETRLRILESIL